MSFVGKVVAGLFGSLFLVTILSMAQADMEPSAPPAPGIETTPGWTESAAGKICAKHTDWKPEECEKVSKELLWIGMDYDMLVYNYGKPNSVNPSNYGSGIRYQYCWHDLSPSCFYDDDNDGKIDSYN